MRANGNTPLLVSESSGQIRRRLDERFHDRTIAFARRSVTRCAGVEVFISSDLGSLRFGNTRDPDHHRYGNRKDGAEPKP